MKISNEQRRKAVEVLQKVIAEIKKIDEENPSKHVKHAIQGLQKLHDVIQSDHGLSNKGLQFVLGGPEKRYTDILVADTLREASADANAEMNSRLAVILSLASLSSEMGALDLFSLGLIAVLASIDVPVNGKVFNSN